MRIRLLLPVLLLPALAMPAFAQAPSPREPSEQELRRAQQGAEAWQAYLLRVAKAVARSDGARDLALAALLEAQARPYDPGRATGLDPDRLRAEAGARGAGDLLTQQLLLAAAVVGDDPARRTAAARRWQALAPGNLAPLMHQGLDTAALLDAAPRLNRNAPELYPLQRWAAGVLRRHAPTAAEWAAFGEGAKPSAEANAAVWSSSLSVLLPDYQPLLRACDMRAPGAAGRAAACRHLSSLLLARPQTMIDERIGLSLARGQATSPADIAALDARRRGVDWRLEQMGKLAMQADGPGGAAAFARLLADASVTTEDAMARRMLAEAGIPAEPPAGWQAPWQRR
ncbi:hypothetical protein H5368_09155 [Luteimonas sp. MC1782]|uniref:hypothetical protein n=1 Tax=Luteimonas sp. MC1782 TaxID=2760305 RepID=UPI0016021503|nr:hypothetical protein [Luteimonas sp. MC1782]MBB1473200.1 hypothetical protein [Luteimonas sp. MC1782]